MNVTYRTWIVGVLDDEPGGSVWVSVVMPKKFDSYEDAAAAVAAVRKYTGFGCEVHEDHGGLDGEPAL
jgi:hypothetical protein